MQGIFQKENTDKALKYGIYRHLPTYEKIIRNLVSFLPKRTSNEESIYNLYSNMKRNRSLLFEESIGVPQEVVLEWIHKIDPFYSAYGKDYYRIVVEYLEMIKIN